MKYPIEVYNEYFYSKPNSFRLLVFISDNCNYNCEYCYNHFPRTHINLNLNLVYEFINDIIFNKYNKSYLYLDLIGGETTFHPKLQEFCKKIKNNQKIFTTVYSNFSKDFNYYKDLIENNVHLLLSWHSICNSNEYKQKFSMFSLDDLQKYITLSIMYENNNIKQSLEIFDYFSKTYGQSFENLEFSILDSNENYNNFSYSKYEFNEFNKRAIKTKTPTTIIKYNDNSYMYVNDNYFFKDVNNTNFKYWLCNAGLDFLFIYFDGTIHPCDENDNTILFNINTQPINNFIMPTKPILCRREHCPCLFDLYKKNIFIKK